ncbi:MAG: dimethylarginine dimethylaminohydrolase family protein [Actinomycetota bacterium]
MPIQNSFGALRSVYVRPPRVADLAAWHEFGWHAAPDPGRAEDEHAALRAELERAGAEVVSDATPVPSDPDAIYAYDPTLPTDRGTILLRPGKASRRREPDVMGADLLAAGRPMLGGLEHPATAEGGDMFWLDARTLLIGRGYRTHDEGIHQLRALLGPEVDVVVFDLPHALGPGSCLHLMSFISPLDRDLAVAFLPMMPVRLVELLRDRGVTLVEVPEEELGSQGPNVLALAPRVALALDSNPETRRRMERAGVDVRTFVGEEISRKGDGGPTCLTRPLDRG